MIKTDFCLPRSIRVKLNSNCQFKCKFCHQEGNSQALDVIPKKLGEAVKVLRDELGFYRIHFTGGEPTLYSKFKDLISTTKELGFVNALTSNGQFKNEKLTELKEIGLSSINFSLHTLNPYVFFNIQDMPLGMKDGVDWSRECIENTVQNILISNQVLETKVNCVVSNNSIGPREVLEFCIQNNIKLRFLNNLSLGTIATNKIKEILLEKRADLIGHEITFLSSSHKLSYQIGDYEFGVKCIRPFYLKSMCDGCDLKKNNKCMEGFYGIRLEDNPIKVRLCLNKNKSPQVQSFSDFIKSPQFNEIKNETENAMKYLRKDSLIDEQKSMI